MKVLIINSGSSTIKFQIFEKINNTLIVRGLVDRIGLDKSYIEIKNDSIDFKDFFKINTHELGIQILFEQLIKLKIINNFSEIVKVGHRVVQGGEYFKKSVLVKEKELNKIKEYAKLAPLHNIPNAVGIEVIQKVLPETKNIAVFDTEFHQTLPEESYMYGVPYEWYEKYGVRRYGMHGISYKYVTQKIAEIKKIDTNDLNVIICHLGNGASIAAIKNGKSYQTSMGMTPLDGLVMGTRSGSIDPSIIEYMEEQTGMNSKELTKILNHESGLKGLSGISSDMRDLNSQIDTNKRVKLAIDVYVNKILEVIGAYYFRLGKIDALCFTAGIGENSYKIREKVVDKLNFLNVYLDNEANVNNEIIISNSNSLFDVMVVPTNEEYQIYLETQKF